MNHRTKRCRQRRDGVGSSAVAAHVFHPACLSFGVLPTRMYRVKFILSDGRKIYPTDKGRFQLVAQPTLDERSHHDFLEHGGYSHDLGAFWMGRPDLAPVRIVEVFFEHESSPLDRMAFVLGGRLASQTFQA